MSLPREITKHTPENTTLASNGHLHNGVVLLLYMTRILQGFAFLC